MKLVINTGGIGTRLYPLTKSKPKVLIEIAGKPILQHVIEWGKKYGIQDILLLNGFMSEEIERFCKENNNFGIRISHSNEPYPLASGGPIKHAEKYLQEPFILVNGDQIMDIDLNKLQQFHIDNNADITAVVHESTHPNNADILKLNTEGRIIRFIAKNEDHTDAGNISNSGIWILNPMILNLTQKNKFIFETELYPKIFQNNLKFMGYSTTEFISDCGTSEKYQECEKFLSKKTKTRILVTGAGGMMGQHLLPLLLNKGNYDILGTYYHPTTNIKELPKEIRIKELDVRDYWKVYQTILEFKPDKILHLAAQSYPTLSLDEPQYTLDTNVIGTINIFEAIRSAKLDPTLLVACSSAEYGFVDEKDLPIKETQPLLPLHPYGVSKVGQDLLSYQYYKNYGMRTLRARIFNTTGPKKVNDVCADFTKQAVLIEKGLQENKFYIGNIDTRRAITDVRDMIEAFLLLMEKGHSGEVYNISGEKAYLVKDILDLILKETNINPEIIVDPKLLRPIDEKIIYGDNTKLKSHTGWQQKIPIETTIKDMIAYWRQIL